MEFRGQNNHTVAARALSDRLSQMSRQTPLTGENINSWNKYNHYYSGKQPETLSPLKTNFYEDEYKKMVSRMDKMVMSAKNRNTVDPFGELVQLSVLADGGDFGYADNPNPIPPQWKRKRVSINSLLKWKRFQDEKHEVFMAMMEKLEEMDKEWYQRKMLQRKQRPRRMPIGDFLIENLPKEQEGIFRMSSTSEGDSSMDSMPVGDFMRNSGPEEDFRMGSMQEEDARIDSTPVQRFGEKEVKSGLTQKSPKSIKKDKIAACRHFAKGWCRQGDACSFQHCVKDSYPDSQKVFLGGLPHFITSSKLVEELGQQGYEVVNEPKIFRGFSPQVCLASNAGATKILKEGKITISGCKVEVRPYKAITKKERDRQIDINKRSVFLGGLPSSVTVQILKASIEKLGMKMTNRPLIKAGFIPKVTLASAQQAQDLVASGTIAINGATINVRPYECKTQPS